jgi:hypothetical protein
MTFSLAGCGGNDEPSDEPGNGDFKYGNGIDYFKTQNFWKEFSIKYDVTYYDESSAGKKFPHPVELAKNANGIYFAQRTLLAPEVDKFIYLKKSDTYSQYQYYAPTSVWVEMGSNLPQMLFDVALSTNTTMAYMTIYASLYTFPAFKKVGTDKVLGINCDKYSYDAGGVKTMTFCIDPATGICLKYDWTYTTGEPISADYKFVCTEFKTTGVTLPAVN